MSKRLEFGPSEGSSLLSIEQRRLNRVNRLVRLPRDFVSIVNDSYISKAGHQQT